MVGSAAVDGGSAAVDVDATTKKRDKKAAHLQRAVDPLLLVSSKSKGPPRPRQFPTQKQPRAMKVCLHDTACAWREVPDLFHSLSCSTHFLTFSVPDLFHSLSHATAKRFVSTASTGEGGEGWSQTSSVDFAVICTRDSIDATALRYKVYLFLRFS